VEGTVREVKRRVRVVASHRSLVERRSSAADLAHLKILAWRPLWLTIMVKTLTTCEVRSELF